MSKTPQIELVRTGRGRCTSAVELRADRAGSCRPVANRAIDLLGFAQATAVNGHLRRAAAGGHCVCDQYVEATVRGFLDDRVRAEVDLNRKLHLLLSDRKGRF